LLSLKAASERHQDGGDADIFAAAIEQLSDEVELIEHINLTGFEDQHALFVIRRGEIVPELPELRLSVWGWSKLWWAEP